MRDGEQSRGAWRTRDEKLRIGRALERMKVDVIEAGFPASSNGDFEAVRAVANAVKDSTACGLCRANDRDIQRAIDALKGAKAWRAHLFFATRALHKKEKPRMKSSAMVAPATVAVQTAASLIPRDSFSTLHSSHLPI